jgi:hypothetical protein
MFKQKKLHQLQFIMACFAVGSEPELLFIKKDGSESYLRWACEAQKLRIHALSQISSVGISNRRR